MRIPFELFFQRFAIAIGFLFVCLYQTNVRAQSLADANNQFSVSLYTALSSDNSENLFFSPYSISTALQMTLPGAKDQTHAQILSVLGMNSLEGVNEKILQFSRQLSGSNEVTFSIANSLWGEASYGIQDNYIQIARQYFNSEVFRVDFKGNPEKQRADVNNWVSQKTNEKIKDLLGPGTVTGSTRLILANAVYFLGKWTHQFDPENTTRRDFFISTDKKTTAQFMSLTKPFQYYENDQMQLVQLPYEGNSFAMEIMLPKKDIKDLEAHLSADSLNEWSSKLTARKVTAQIPRFKSESSFALVPILSRLGIQDAFKFGVADFSGISNNKELYITDVAHKAFVEVGEKGTEAAAATAIVMRVGSILQPEAEKPILFRADHPFIYVIKHIPSGAIIFIGRMNNPPTE